MFFSTIQSLNAPPTLAMPCPTCNRQVEWNPESPWRPFCSERCKLIDLGAWASERHAIPGESYAANDGEDAPKVQPDVSKK